MLEILDQISDPIMLSAYLSILMCTGSVLVSVWAKAWKNPKLRWIQVYVGSSLFTSIVSMYLMWVMKKETIIAMNMFSVLSLSSFSAFFYVLLNPIRKSIAFVFILLLGYVIWTFWISGSIFEFSSDLFWTQSIFFFLLTIYGFYYLFVHAETPDIHSLPEFWVLSASLMYFAGTLFFLFLSDRLVSYDVSAVQSLWYIHNIFDLTKYLLLAIGFYVLKNRKSLVTIRGTNPI